MSIVEEPVSRPDVCGATIFDQVVLSRFACRDFSDRPVPRRMIEDILDVARFAPSGANIQPWRVHVVAGRARDQISRALVQAHRDISDQHASEYQYYSPELPEPHASRRAGFGCLFYGELGIAQSDSAARARQTAKNYTFFGAPVGLIVTIDRRLAVGSWLDLGMFIQTVLLAARARGLESCPQETFARYHRLLRAMLPIAPEQMVVCGISIGWARDAARPAQRLMPRADVAEFASFTGFD